MTDRPNCVQTDICLASHTTFHIGGTADFFASVKNKQELQTVLTWAKGKKLPIVVLGGGSNIVFADNGFRGLVLKLDFTGITESIKNNNVILTAAAGERWDALVSYTVTAGYSGLENLSGIPGSVGAAPIQNIGAYGVEVKDRISSVCVYDSEQQHFIYLDKDDCNFAYRHSLFKTNIGRKYIVISVNFILDTVFTPEISYPDVKNYFKEITPSLKKVRSAILEIRATKFPDLSKVGTAGSFFKNPIINTVAYEALKTKYPNLPGYKHGNQIKVSAAWLIDNVAKAKGVRKGSIGTHDTQALVFVNYGGATAHELDMFAQQISNTIFDKTGIELEKEVCFVNELGVSDTI